MDYRTEIANWLWEDEGIWPFIRELAEGGENSLDPEHHDWVSQELRKMVEMWLFDEPSQKFNKYENLGGSEQWLMWARRTMTDEDAVASVNWSQVRQDLLDSRSKERVTLVVRDVR